VSEDSIFQIREQIEAAFNDMGMCGFPEGLYVQLTSYLELLVRWNSRLNLTSVRAVSEMIRIHLAECAFAACQLPADVETLLDYGSGAGFPGIVVAACRPEVRVFLAEANTKKSSFLREVARTTGIEAQVFHGRVNSMVPSLAFDVVTLRAVEQMEEAIPVAVQRARKYVMLLTTTQFVPIFSLAGRELDWDVPIPVPNTYQRVVLLGRQRLFFS
jgi:16S rRNA (guanine527-N7)-methyltransferase